MPMFENFKALLHSNETLLKTWAISNKADHSFCISKEFNFEEGMCYSDICMEMLGLGHSSNILVEIEKRESSSGDHHIVVSITISATEAETLTADCQKLALSVERLIH